MPVLPPLSVHLAQQGIAVLYQVDPLLASLVHLVNTALAMELQSVLHVKGGFTVPLLPPLTVHLAQRGMLVLFLVDPLLASLVHLVNTVLAMELQNVLHVKVDFIVPLLPPLSVHLAQQGMAVLYQVDPLLASLVHLVNTVLAM